MHADEVILHEEKDSIGNFISMFYNEEGYAQRSYCRRKVWLFS